MYGMQHTAKCVHVPNLDIFLPTPQAPDSRKTDELNNVTPRQAPLLYENLFLRVNKYFY